MTTKQLKTMIGCGASALIAVSASATSFTVPGTSDPWLAKATIDNVGTPEAPDTAPGQSPVFAGSVTPGSLVSWSATGLVGHPGDDAGPNGAWTISRVIGANNGISDLPNTPINGLVGVWGLASGGGISFFMGSSGSLVVPAGVNELYMGTMDGYGWANNTGHFDVSVQVPDGGSTIALMGGGLAMIGAVSRRFRK